MEGRNEKTGKLSGRTESFVIIDFDGDDDLIGEFAYVEVTEAKNWVLSGKIKE